MPPDASLTPLGWCAAGPTLLPMTGDKVFNIVLKKAAAETTEEYEAQLATIKKKVVSTD
jgi:hypothetical protein